MKVIMMKIVTINTKPYVGIHVPGSEPMFLCDLFSFTCIISPQKRAACFIIILGAQEHSILM